MSRSNDIDYPSVHSNGDTVPGVADAVAELEPKIRYSSYIRTLVERIGLEIFGEPDRFRAFLMDYFPFDRRENRALHLATAENIPEILRRAATNDAMLDIEAGRQRTKLETELGVAAALAAWTIDVLMLAVRASSVVAEQKRDEENAGGDETDAAEASAPAPIPVDAPPPEAAGGSGSLPSRQALAGKPLVWLLTAIGSGVALILAVILADYLPQPSPAQVSSLTNAPTSPPLGKAPKVEPAFSPPAGKAPEVEPAISPPVGEAPKVEPAFTDYENRDLVGDDLASMRGLTLRECVTACAGNSQCQAYSFDRWNQYCFLKSKVGRLTIDPRSVTGVRRGLPVAQMADAPITMARYRGKIFPGNGYKTLSHSRFETCESSCREDESCVAFTFYKEDRACRLFNRTGEYFPNKMTDSGIKTQSP